MKHARKVIVAAIIVAFCMGIGWCPSVLAAAPKEILIGTNLPMTGMLAGPGREQKWSYEQAVKDINATGGIFVKEYNQKLPVKLIVADDESNAGKAGKAVERLIKIDKVHMLLGGFAAPFGVIPGCITAEKYQRYYHTSICFIPPWLEKNFKWSTLFFFDLDEGTSAPFQIWGKLPEDKRPKKPALLMEDTFDGRALSGVFRSQVGKYGYQFALDETMAVGAKDYSAQILKAKQLGVDAILLFTSETDSITFVRQMKEANFSVPYLHGWKGAWSGDFYNALGNDGQYVLSDGFWSMDFPYPGAKELGERYHKDFGKYSVSVGATYALCQSLFQAIEKAGTLDGAKVREAVLGHTFETMMGPVKYDPQGVAVFTSTASQWWDGKQMTVYPFDVANWELKLAPPWNERK
jgi:branched-chain amino acid transport system substrate-binding protein